jgi:hypothetical protein
MIPKRGTYVVVDTRLPEASDYETSYAQPVEAPRRSGHGRARQHRPSLPRGSADSKSVDSRFARWWRSWPALKALPFSL